MNILVKVLLKLAREINVGVNGKAYEYVNHSVDVTLTGQAASDHIKKLISSGSPFVVSRLGIVELNVVLAYLFNKEKLFCKLRKYIRGYGGQFWYDKKITDPLCFNAGFYPGDNEDYLDDFAELYLKCMEKIDVLGSFSNREMLLQNQLKNALKIDIGDITPFVHKDPWSEALQGKNVLVIHPFAETIDRQYSRNRKSIFSDTRVLPKFNLRTLKAVQSAGFNKPPDHKTWFDALDYMKKLIDKQNFDIALIGCGAYGLPLACHVKQAGKQAIHMGGVLQALFGIKSKRFDEYIDEIRAYYTESWVRPNKNERPNGYERIEGGCYW